MWPYPWTHVGTPSHLGHMDQVAATMPSQAHAGAAEEAPDIGQWEGQDVPLVRPSSCFVKGGIPSSRRYLPIYLPQALTQACHSYTHTLLGVVEEHVPGRIGPPVKVQENTALLSDCGLTGTPIRVSLSGLGGKECSVCVHSVYDEVVGLSSPLTAEVQFFCCDMRRMV